MTEWQTIETAPRDGLSVLGYANGEMAVIYWWYEDSWQIDVAKICASESCWWPTHWMPLPKPPKTESL